MLRYGYIIVSWGVDSEIIFCGCALFQVECPIQSNNASGPLLPTITIYDDSAAADDDDDGEEEEE